MSNFCRKSVSPIAAAESVVTKNVRGKEQEMTERGQRGSMVQARLKK